MLRISILLNLALLGGLIFFLASQRNEETASAPVSSEAKPSVQASATPASAASPGMESKSFRWRQLESTNDYRVYVANLRAIGCPEPTVEDIVRGDTERAFSWERRHLGLDGSGTGPWSRQAEMQLVASLLGVQPPAGTTTLAQSADNGMGRNGGGNEVAESNVPAQSAANRMRGIRNDEVAEASVPFSSTGTESPSYPLFLQNPNWSALGFTAEQQEAIAQVRQQFENEISSLNQNAGDAENQNSSTTVTGDGLPTPDPNDPAALTQWQRALQDADQTLRDLLGSQGYMAYEQQQYYAWYQPQAAAAAASGEPLNINPALFTETK